MINPRKVHLFIAQNFTSYGEDDHDRLFDFLSFVNCTCDLVGVEYNGNDLSREGATLTIGDVTCNYVFYVHDDIIEISTVTEVGV
ncbi:MAG: hypothetical protein ACRCWQ_13730 [Bacilli bacterium]